MTTVHTRSTPIPLIYYRSGMRVDADGAPGAYTPKGKGLDYLANAGKPGNYYGLVTNEKGIPYVQGPNDPCPGFYVSATALTDRSKARNNPAKYVDSSSIPYIAVPSNALSLGVKMGDLAVVMNENNKAVCMALVADVGPKNKWGEGSIYLCQQLGINDSPKKGGCDSGILYVVFTGTSSGWPRDVEEFTATALDLLEEAGGLEAFED